MLADVIKSADLFSTEDVHQILQTMLECTARRMKEAVRNGFRRMRL